MLVAALVCLTIAGGVLLAAARLTLSIQHQARIDAQTMQARWLAESGLERGAAKLAADRNYKGETWQIDAKQLPGGAEVRIEVLPVEGQAGRRRLQVEAAYPAQEPVARRTRGIVVEIKE